MNEQLMRGVMTDDTEKVQDALVRGADPCVRFNMGVYSSYQNVPVLFLAAIRSIEMLDILLNGGADVNAVINRGFGLITYICNNCPMGLMRESLVICIRHGANIDQQRIESTGNTALHEMVILRRYNVASLLMELGANINAINWDGKSVLMDTLVALRLSNMPLSARSGELSAADIVRELIRHGANVNSVGGRNNSTPLIEAINADSDTIVMMLLEAGANPSKRDANGLSPLRHCFTAYYYRNINPMVKALLQAGATDLSTDLCVFGHSEQYKKVSRSPVMDYVENCEYAQIDASEWNTSSTDAERMKLMNTRLDNNSASSVSEFVALSSGELTEANNALPMLYPDLMIMVVGWMMVESVHHNFNTENDQ